MLGNLYDRALANETGLAVTGAHPVGELVLASLAAA
jgi:hypothetical protein